MIFQHHDSGTTRDTMGNGRDFCLHRNSFVLLFSRNDDLNASLRLTAVDNDELHILLSYPLSFSYIARKLHHDSQ
jgi:hypothetical protein